VIPIDEAVNASLPPGLNTIVVHNGFNPSTLKLDSNDKNYWDSIPQRKFTVGMVGNLIGHKGFDEFIEAANVLVKEGFDINFIVVGDRKIKVNFITRMLRLVGLSHNIRDSIVNKITNYNLSGFFHLLPFTTDLADVYSRFDVLCFPNQTDAIGRPVFEAAYYGKPSIVCLSKVMGDTFIDRETGINIRAKSSSDLIESIKFI
jgi:glycosyltransferase involved in cell wall biosynthesis